MRLETQNNWKKLADLLERKEEKEFCCESEGLSAEDKSILHVLKSIRLDFDVNHASEMKKEVQESIYHKIFNANEESGKRKNLNALSLLLSIAATIAILLCVATSYYISKEKEEIPSWVVFSSPHGVSRIVLPDSSVVAINKGSTISYTTGYNRTERLVKLTGEGYFDVTPNKEIPFIVSTKTMDVKVLGTVFNVSAYEEDDEVVTSLLSGSVELESKIDKQTYHLNPQQSAIFNNSTANIEIQPFETEYVTGWMEGQLHFKKNNFQEICRVLEKKFNCTIEVENEEVQSKSFTGKFINDESLPQILEILRVVVPFDYTITNNHVKIN